MYRGKNDTKYNNILTDQSLSQCTFEDTPRHLIYVHIGKCGGKTLWEALQNSSVIQRDFDTVTRVHTQQPPALRHARYLIVVRNPIERAVSAFNWRYKLVVQDGLQKNRFRGERNILLEFQTLNALSEMLYNSQGILDSQVAADYRNIHHLKEDITFYLDPLLGTISKDQVFALLATESLAQDIARLLQVGEVSQHHENRTNVTPDRLALSERARTNLRRFLSEDYSCIERMLSLTEATEEQRATLLA